MLLQLYLNSLTAENGQIGLLVGDDRLELVVEDLARAILVANVEHSSGQLRRIAERWRKTPDLSTWLHCINPYN